MAVPQHPADADGHAPATSVPCLAWAVKSDFIEYLRSLEDGMIATGAGAVYVGGEFRFPQDDASAESYRGAVRFTGHRGILDLVFAEPRIVSRGTTAVLSVRRRPDPSSRFDLVTLDDLVASDSGGTFRTVLLTSEGTRCFQGVYGPGTPFDPVTLHVGAPG